MRAGAVFIMALAGAAGAAADTVHRVRFAVPPVILVWGDAHQAPPGAVMTGTLAPAATNPGIASFRVATNTPFEICVSSVGGRSLSADDLAAAEFEIEMTDEAPNARASGAAMVFEREGALCVWQAGSRTAVRSGPPPTQAVSFAAHWNGDDLGAIHVFVRPLAPEAG